MGFCFTTHDKFKFLCSSKNKMHVLSIFFCFFILILDELVVSYPVYAQGTLYREHKKQAPKSRTFSNMHLWATTLFRYNISLDIFFIKTVKILFLRAFKIAECYYILFSLFQNKKNTEARIIPRNSCIVNSKKKLYIVFD